MLESGHPNYCWSVISAADSALSFNEQTGPTCELTTSCKFICICDDADFSLGLQIGEPMLFVTLLNCRVIKDT